MILITEELVRKRAEHNEGIIGTLEELSLHQEDIEKIEHLNNWCKELQILYLQANQISKIENLNKLKKLQYLNLAINNIEKIENLERCESLEKLDLTLNFIGDIESVKSLSGNIHLKHLYLTGNPCHDFENYREYVIANLPQLQTLDNKEITRSERIKALQNLEKVEKKIKDAQKKYQCFRAEQKVRLERTNNWNLTDEEFWKTVSENSPETRLEIAKRQKRKGSNQPDIIDHKNDVKRTVKLFNASGRPLNVNQAKLNFHLSDVNPEYYELDIAVYKYLDSNLINIDLQPIYVKVTVKGKLFQIVFPEEISIEKSTALRSQTTGHLLLKLPKLNYKTLIKKPTNLQKNSEKKPKPNTKNHKEYLEVTGVNNEMDFSKIVENNQNKSATIDSYPEVPMLEYA